MCITGTGLEGRLKNGVGVLIRRKSSWEIFKSNCLHFISQNGLILTHIYCYIDPIKMGSTPASISNR